MAKQFCKIGLYILLWGGFLANACERVDFSEEKKIPPDEKPDEDLRNDSLTAYTVAEAQDLFSRITADSLICVAGYIVGTCGQFSLSSSRFEAPFEVKGNLLLADSPYERDAEKCLPVRLKNKTEERDSLNLSDHPQLLGRSLLVKGWLETYYRVPGIKDLQGWAWVDIGTPADTASVGRFPFIDEREELIKGGR